MCVYGFCVCVGCARCACVVYALSVGVYLNEPYNKNLGFSRILEQTNSSFISYVLLIYFCQFPKMFLF